MDHLRYIRETMERAGSFTAVPGLGGVAIGFTALAAAALAARAASLESWVAIWVGEAVVACLTGITGALIKSRRANLPLFSRPGRKFLVGFVPPLAVGALLTVALVHARSATVLPGMWLLLYGTGMLSGGAASVRIVPLMGVCFMAMGAIALFVSPEWGNWLLAAGFGGIHIFFGVIITVKYGG